MTGAALASGENLKHICTRTEKRRVYIVNGKQSIAQDRNVSAIMKRGSEVSATDIRLGQVRLS